MKLIGVLTGSVLLALGVAGWLRQQELSRIATTKSNLYEVQLAVERYQVEDTWVSYPLTVESVIQAGYIPRLPINPYTGEPMRQVRPGDNPTAGDFSYLPALEELQPGHEVCDNYLLVAYQDAVKRPIWTVDAADLQEAGWNSTPPDLDRVNWKCVAVLLQNNQDHQRDRWAVRRAIQAAKNLQAIQSAIEEYLATQVKSSKVRSYPASLQQVRDEGLLSELPPNPYDPDLRPMPEVAVGEHKAGGITYLPLVPYSGDLPDVARVYPHYLIVAYGDTADPHESASSGIRLYEPAERIEWEYVVAAVQSGPEK